MLDGSLAITLLIGSIGSGITAQIGAARLLYSMGRDNVIPRKVFGHLDKKHASPVYNVIIIGVLAMAGALMLNYEECARLINFGAFFAFMGVNIASMKEYFFKQKNYTMKSVFKNFIPPFIGFTICLVIWLNLPLKTFIIGGSWMFVGIVYLAISTKGFKLKSAMIDFSVD
jgi:putrescine importer